MNVAYGLAETWSSPERTGDGNVDLFVVKSHSLSALREVQEMVKPGGALYLIPRRGTCKTLKSLRTVSQSQRHTELVLLIGSVHLTEDLIAMNSEHALVTSFTLANRSTDLAKVHQALVDAGLDSDITLLNEVWQETQRNKPGETSQFFPTKWRTTKNSFTLGLPSLLPKSPTWKLGLCVTWQRLTAEWMVITKWRWRFFVSYQVLGAKLRKGVSED